MQKGIFVTQELSKVLLEVADLTRVPERRPVPPIGTPLPIIALMTECWSRLFAGLNLLCLQYVSLLCALTCVSAATLNAGPRLRSSSRDFPPSILLHWKVGASCVCVLQWLLLTIATCIDDRLLLVVDWLI
jgi:hypothetical protein